MSNQGRLRSSDVHNSDLVETYRSLKGKLEARQIRTSSLGLSPQSAGMDSNAEQDAAGQLCRQGSNNLYRQHRQHKDDAG